MLTTDLIRGPVGMVLGLIVWLVVFSLLIGAINGWYLQAVDAGVVSGERFDRVVVKGAHTKADDAWVGVTGTTNATERVADAGTNATVYTLAGTTAYLLEEGETAGTCRIGSIKGGAASRRSISIEAGTYFTPLGSEVYSEAASSDGDAKEANIAAADIAISGCEWGEEGSVFNAGGLGGLVEIILQAAGLAPPIALLFALGTFGSSFMKNMGSHPILAAVLTVILLLLVATLLNTFVPFLTAAFEAIDKNRFVMYDEGLGNLSVVVGNFYGVVVVASMMMIAWQVVKHLRGGNVINAAQRM